MNLVTFTLANKYVRLLSDSVFARLWICAVCREFYVGIVTQQQTGAVMFELKKNNSIDCQLCGVRIPVFRLVIPIVFSIVQVRNKFW